MPLLKWYSQKDCIRNLVQQVYDISTKYFDVSLSAVVKEMRRIA